MNDRACCPVCSETRLEELGTRGFRRESEHSNYASRIRQRVLFELWNPGRDELTIRFVLCGRCGLVFFLPRPDEDDLAAKYRLFEKKAARRAEKRPDARRVETVTAIDRTRSLELWEFLALGDAARGRAILDLGGRFGGLMCEFVARGARCAVADYGSAVADGVERVATTLADLPRTRKFDVVVSSHVLEHLPDPVATLRGIAPHLEPDGLLCVEVPLEILGRLPRHVDAVTHINFFAEPSLRELLRLAGYRVERCENLVATFEHGRPGPAIRALARLAPDVEPRRDPDPGPAVRAILSRPIDDSRIVPEEDDDAVDDR